MKKLTILFLTVSLSGCSFLVPPSHSKKVLTAINDRYWAIDRLNQRCLVEGGKALTDPAPFGLCNTAVIAIEAAKIATEKAQQAVDRGGDLPLQVKDVKAADKAMVSAAKALK